MGKKTLLAYFGHHRCGTTWMNSVIQPVCRDLGLKLFTANNPGMFDEKLDSFVAKNNIDFLAYTNADFRFVKTLDNFSGFHLIRDPRDVLVSCYFSHLYSHQTEGWPALVEHRARLQKISKDEGLLLEMEFRRKELEALYNWDYSQPNILELRMEDFMHSPYEAIVNAISYLNLVDENVSLKKKAIFFLTLAINRIHVASRGVIPFRFTKRKIPVDFLLGYIFANRFSKKAKGRKEGEEDVKSHFRKGIAGDWVNHFNEEHRSYFKEKYDDLLIKLGYETDSDW